MSEYDDWKQENDRWEAYLYPNGVLRNKLGITKAAKWHKMERDFVTARNNDLRPNTGLTTGNVGEELFAGTTSACAENTTDDTETINMHGNYLRVRGEYATPSSPAKFTVELPPRARRIHLAAYLMNKSHGTTSACAENTDEWFNKENILRNYLRVRGEYQTALRKTQNLYELPPRARRIRPAGGGRRRDHGTTSACAENTAGGGAGPRLPGNYLRVRGEYHQHASTGWNP